MIDGVAGGEVARLGKRVQLLVLAGPLVAPLIGVDVVEAGGVLEPRGPCPVEREGERRPGRHRRELLLADVVVQAAAVLADAAAEDEAGDGGSVGVIAVVPLVHARADDDRALAAGLLRGGGPLPGEADHLWRGDAREALLPGRRVCGVRVVVTRGVVAGEAAGDAVLGEEQVVDGGHLHRPARGLDGPHRHAAQRDPARGVLVEGHLGDAVVPVEEGGPDVDLGPVDAVLHLEVPLPFLVLPPEPQGPSGHAGGLGCSVPDQELEVAVLRVAGAGDLACAQHAARSEAAACCSSSTRNGASLYGARSRGSTASASRGGTPSG